MESNTNFSFSSSETLISTADVLIQTVPEEGNRLDATGGEQLSSISAEVSSNSSTAEGTPRVNDVAGHARPSPCMADYDPLLGATGHAEAFEDSAEDDEIGPAPAEDNGARSEWRYYGNDFRVSMRGVFVRRVDKDGNTTWEQISRTPIYIEALTRDRRGENWGTHLTVTNRDGKSRQLAIPHALIAAEKANDIASTLAALGVGVVFGRSARQAIVEFLTTDVPERITSVAQIGWHESDGAHVFVLADQTLVPPGFSGARPVLQTMAIQNQTGLSVSGSVTDWADQIAQPLAENSNIHLCVGTALAGPLLHQAAEPPGFFHLWGASKTGKSLAAAVGQSVWGRPKSPGEADACVSACNFDPVRRGIGVQF